MYMLAFLGGYLLGGVICSACFIIVIIKTAEKQGRYKE